MAQVAPNKWWQVYIGDKECHLFMALARGIHEWRTTEGLATAAKVATVDVEAICAKYVPLGIIDHHPKEPNRWRYWERAALQR